MADRSRLRLTMRGRVVAAAGTLALALALAGSVMSAGAAAGPAGPERTTVVREDDTLWLIARRELPSLEPYEAVDVIRRLNGIGDYTIHPGQHLRLPPHR
jgi:hypothetical protein